MGHRSTSLRWLPISASVWNEAILQTCPLPSLAPTMVAGRPDIGRQLFKRWMGDTLLRDATPRADVNHTLSSSWFLFVCLLSRGSGWCLFRVCVVEKNRCVVRQFTKKFVWQKLHQLSSSLPLPPFVLVVLPFQQYFPPQRSMPNYPFTTNLTTSSCRRSMTSLTASSSSPPATTNFKPKRSYPCHHSISRPQPSNTIRVRVRDTRWLKPTSDASKDPSTTTPSAWI